MLVYSFPPFHIVPLRQNGQRGAVAAFDPAAYVDRFWAERLIPGAAKAVDAAELVAAIEEDRDAARRKYGRRVVLGGPDNYFVKGTGRVVSVQKDAVTLVLGDDRSQAQVSLQTGKIFGNAVRDGTGLLDLNDFARLQDFNALSSELNRRIEEQVLPKLREKAAVGVTIRFVGCAEITDEESDLHPPADRALHRGGTMSDAGDIVLEARGLSKSFPGVKALDEVALTLRQGRLTALLGENGAGKSTLMNIIAGVFPPDAGELLVGGERVHFANPRQARDHGIAMIFQELNLVPGLTVAENIFLGREPLRRNGLIHYAAMNRDAAAWLQRLDLDVPPTTPVGRLRVGQQQVVEIAKALAGEVRILIMDEPTSAITERETEVLFRRIADLKRRGVSIAYITHRLEELPRIADDLVVMRDGRTIGSAPLGAMSRDDIVRMMVGRDLNEGHSGASSARGDEVLRVEDLTLGHPDRPGDFLVQRVGFRVRRGEVLGIFGLMGAGRTELLECLFGLHGRTCSGDVWIDGRRVALRSPADAIAHGLALAPEDRKRDGLVLSMSVAENASLASLERAERFGLLRARAEQEHVRGYLERFRVKTPSLDQPIRDLSGGNQQKVILAKWLATGPRVLLLDEPTRGIDIQAKKEIYALINELTNERPGGRRRLLRTARDPGRVRSHPRHVRGPRDRRVHPSRGDRGERSCTRHCRESRGHHAEKPARTPSPIPVADRAGGDGPGAEPAVGQVPHPRERLEHPAPDLGQPVPVHRHDPDHSRRRDRSLGGGHPGPRRRRRGGIPQERRGPLVAGRDGWSSPSPGRSSPASWSARRPVGSTG